MQRFGNLVSPLYSPTKICFLVSLLLVSSLAKTADVQPEGWFPTEQRIPGGVALIDISDEYQPGYQVVFRNHPVKVIHQGDASIAIVGIPLQSQTEVVKLEIRDLTNITGHLMASIKFNLLEADYPTEHLTITDNNKVSPNSLSLKRIRQESLIINKALRQWQIAEVDFQQMQMPVTGRLSSEFGRRRIINDQPRKPHSGIDIAAPLGTEVIAPNGGVISAMGDYFFNGNTLFIDHGEGMVSMFCHLDKILVKVGDPVSKGQLVANVGSSGRVTGPHLHWSLSLNDARVNPLLFTSGNLSIRR